MVKVASERIYSSGWCPKVLVGRRSRARDCTIALRIAYTDYLFLPSLILHRNVKSMNIMALDASDSPKFSVLLLVRTHASSRRE